MFKAFRRSLVAKAAPKSFFKCTENRWLYNEKQQLEARFLQFDWVALQNAANVVVGAECVKMVKHAEGHDSRIFLLIFDNGTEIIAKLPTPLAGHPHLSTASEVATMDYARTILDLPVPKVLSWCSRAERTKVGAEYILMERAPGEEIHKSWDASDRRRRDWRSVVKRIIAMQGDMGSRVFSQIGNIYFTEDVAPHLRERPLYAPGTPDAPGADRFKLGPIVNRNVFPAGRILPETDLGPFPDAVSYFSALVRIEQRWLKHSAVPRAPADPFIINQEDNDPTLHVQLLKDFLEVIPALLPPSTLQAPVLWHADLNPGNVFVHPDTPPSLSSIIDWRDISVLPYFMQDSDSHPAFLNYPTDDRVIFGEPGQKVPRVPDNIRSLPKADREHLTSAVAFATLRLYYDWIQHHHGSDLHRTLAAIPYIEQVQVAFELCNRTWFYGLRVIRRPLILFQQKWDVYAPGIPWPTTRLSQEEMIRYIKSDALERQIDYETQAAELREKLGVGPDGSVPRAEYDEVKRQSAVLRVEWDSSIGPFPLQDGGRSTTFVGLLARAGTNTTCIGHSSFHAGRDIVSLKHCASREVFRPRCPSRFRARKKRRPGFEGKSFGNGNTGLGKTSGGCWVEAGKSSK